MQIGLTISNTYGNEELTSSTEDNKTTSICWTETTSKKSMGDVKKKKEKKSEI